MYSKDGLGATAEYPALASQAWTSSEHVNLATGKEFKINGVTVLSGNSLGTGITGVKIVTFLDGRLDTDKRVKVLDGEYQGTYKVITKAHELDYEGEAWSTTLTCKNDT